VAGWTINRLGDHGGHEVLRLDDANGEETLWGLFGANVPAEEVIEAVVMAAEPGDWLIDANGEPSVIAAARGE
jgi:hypothetical protein